MVVHVPCCPHCGHVLDPAALIEEELPEVGHVREKDQIPRAPIPEFPICPSDPCIRPGAAQRERPALLELIGESLAVVSLNPNRLCTIVAI